MTSEGSHDPVALFAFAMQERDWVLAALIASAALRRRPALRSRLEASSALAASSGPGPSSLAELEGWARLARALGIGNGDGGRASGSSA